MRKWLTILLGGLCLTSGDALAQADRHHAQAGIGYASTSGPLVDSVNFRASMSYWAGYQWAPSRTWSFGLMGWFAPADVLTNDPASVFSMTSIATFRLIKHGISPYASAEAGFSFLAVPDSLMGGRNLDPDLGFTLSGAVGVLVPIAEKVELDMAARYSRSSIGVGLTQLHGLFGVRYRLR